MTKRRAFKTRVRAEMALTGRTYAQAAARVEASNPARRSDVHPPSALVVALLRTAELTLDPVVAYGVGGGLGFMLAVFRYRDVPHPLLTLVCQHHPAPSAPAILRRLEIAHVMTNGRREADHLLDDAGPAILPIARSSVPWLGSSVDAREEHIVLAVPAGENVSIQDGTGASASMTRPTLLAAYAASRRRHPVVALDHRARLPHDLRPALDAGLAATVSGMTEPVLGNAFDVNFGLSGLRKWGRLADAGGREGLPHLFADSGLWRERLVDGIDREFTAPTAGRPLFAQALERTGSGQAAAAFRESGRRWRQIADAAARGDLDFAVFGTLLRSIEQREEEGIDRLSEWLARR